MPPPGPESTIPRRDNGAQGAPQGCCSSREHKGRQVAASPSLVVLSPPWVNRCPLLPSPPPTPSKTLSHFPSGKSGSQTAAPAAQGLLFPMDFITTRMLQLLPGCPLSLQRLWVAALSPPAPLTPARKVLWGAQRGWERLQVLLGRRDGKGWMQGWGSGGQTRGFWGSPPIWSTQQPSPHPHRARGLDNPRLDVAPGKFLPSPRSSQASSIPIPAGSEPVQRLGAKAAQGNTIKFGSDAPSPSSSLEKEQDLSHWDTPATPQATLCLSPAVPTLSPAERKFIYHRRLIKDN